jgi:hypothetical protein
MLDFCTFNLVCLKNLILFFYQSSWLRYSERKLPILRSPEAFTGAAAGVVAVRATDAAVRAGVAAVRAVVAAVRAADAAALEVDRGQRRSRRRRHP